MDRMLSLLPLLVISVPGLVIPDVAVAQRSQIDSWSHIQTRLLDTEFGFQNHDNKHTASNFVHAIKAEFENGIAHFETRAGAHVRLQLLGLERLNHSTLVAQPITQSHKNQLSIDHGTLEEWYHNTDVGFEHGFRVYSQLPGHGPLTVRVGLSGDLEPRIDSDGDIALYNAAGQMEMRYWGLKAWDAIGTPTVAAMQLSQTLSGHWVIELVVDDSNAIYPLTIDPYVASQIAKVTPSDGGYWFNFGWSVAVHGDRMVVGARHKGGGIGSAYLFERNQGGSEKWQEAIKLAPADANYGDQFGISVAIDKHRVVVGSYNANTTHINAGAAYVFERNTGGESQWGQSKKLMPSDAAYNDNFGESVAISGDVIAVSAPGDDDVATNAGSAYLFHQNKGGANQWGLAKKVLVKALCDFCDVENVNYGHSLALSGNTLIVGAQYAWNEDFERQGAAYVYDRHKGGENTWGATQIITDNDPSDLKHFGASVAISGDLIVVGAHGDDEKAYNAGAGYIYRRNSGGANAWGQTQKITATKGADSDQLGWSVATNGETVTLGARGDDDQGLNAGAAYIFSVKQGGVELWEQAAKLTGKTISTVEITDEFSFSLASHGNHVAVGSYQADDQSTDSGNVLLFKSRDGGWLEKSTVTGTASKADLLGTTLSLDGSHLIAGLPQDADKGANAGACAIFSQNKGTMESWSQQVKLIAKDGKSNEWLGSSVAISQNTAIAGAPGPKVGSSISGSAYIFDRNKGGADTWGQLVKLTASDGSKGAQYGCSVAIDGDFALIGAQSDKSQGATYVHMRNQGGANKWGATLKLTDSDGAQGWNFGAAVDLSGQFAVIGSPQVTAAKPGVAYIHGRNTGGVNTWGKITQLVAPDGVNSDGFGSAVAIDGEVAVVGAPNAGKKGTIYVFSRNQKGANKWGFVAQTNASDGVNGGLFGHALDIRYSQIVVGAPGQSKGQGAAYLLERNTGGVNGWQQTALLTASKGAVNDRLGAAVAAGLNTVFVGASGDDNAAIDAGSIVRFTHDNALTAYDDAYQTTENKALTISAPGVLLNDKSTVPGKKTLTLIKQPKNGTVTLSSDGGFVYTPKAQTSGIDAFTYTFSVGSQISNAATVAINVKGVNDAPVAVDDSATVYEDAVITIEVLANDSDVDNTAAELTITNVTQPTDGVVAIANDKKTVTFQRKAGFFGTSSFKYTVSDGAGGSAVGQVTVTVTGCSDGKIQAANNETCDDGNTKIGDGCNATCAIEKGFKCQNEPSVCYSTCGDGIKASNEQCDDGNTEEGDCCTAKCNLVTEDTVCRKAAGPCDIAETCLGKTGFCPNNAFAEKGTTCRKAISFCDIEEQCSGSDAQCPDNKTIEDGVGCNDSDACTTADQCEKGLCIGGAAPDCDDNNLCTDDSCNTKSGCVNVSNTLNCDDKNACTTKDVCSNGKCQGGVPLVCDDKNPCTSDSCDEKAGCEYSNNTLACDDANACTTKDVCAKGKCVGGAPPNCDDNKICTDDTCDKKEGCVNAVDDSNICDDGDKCNGDETCSNGLCQSPGPLKCDDNNLCTDDACDSKTGCSNTPNTIKCNDDNKCTTVDQCVESKCVGSKAPDCDDQNPCTDDTCDPEKGCINTANTLACNDGNACTTNDTCNQGKCIGGEAPKCDDKNPCTDDSCDEKTGCTYVNNTSPCTDNNECTTKDTCSAGKCVPGPTAECNDKNPCTDDSCDKKVGCVFTANDTNDCHDNNKCNGLELCKAGKCVETGALDCDDKNPCTDDSCDNDNGCVNTANENDCNDGNACSTNDVCKDKVCEGGASPDCNDKNPCTTDTCDMSLGCINTANDMPCDDGNACTTQDTCHKKSCQGGPAPDCNDNNLCTDDSCQSEEGCINSPNTVPCTDKNACTLEDSCSKGDCQSGKPLVCDDNNPCTSDSCNDGQCQFVPTAGGDCSDGDKCTVGEACSDGLCKGGKPVCECKVNSDCKDDGNLCNGTPVCKDNTCIVDPDTVVTCDLTIETNCAKNVCAPETGVCQLTAITDGTICDDEDACTEQDECLKGACTGKPKICNDKNPCTTDVCTDSGECKFSPVDDQTSCDDGNACTAKDNCTTGTCQGTKVECNDDNPCTDDTCSTNKGCVHTANTNDCEDGSACTVDDKCIGGFCKPGGPKVCNDSSPCTDDSCDAAKGCLFTNNTAVCDDGDPCTPSDLCHKGTCVGDGLVDCSDDNPCTDDACVSGKGCKYTDNNKSCDDGNQCTANDGCQKGLCVSGNNTCQCEQDSDCSASEDDNLCNGTLVCQGNTCVVDPKSVVTCDTSKDSACIETVCKTKTGQCESQALPDTTPCVDDNVCTIETQCKAGACVGLSLDCSDGKACTKDSCDETTGCQHSPTSGSGCDDKNPCTLSDLCDKGQCVGSGLKDCNDDNPCTADQCDPTKGCVNNPVTLPCDDNNACTVNESCKEGACQGGKPLDCNDNNPCTDDACVGAKGCVHGNNANPCDDNNACTSDDKCASAQCNGGSPVVCDDNNPCTDDLCEPKTGCVSVSNKAPCEDNDACTLQGQCKDGGCQLGQAIQCNDNNPCTQDSCTDGKCNYEQTDGAPCDDGNPCTTQDACLNGTCTAGASTCDCTQTSDCATQEDGNPCNGTLVCQGGQCVVDPVSVVSCDPAVGGPCFINQCNQQTGSCELSHAPKGTTCDDAKPCTVSDACNQGFCQGKSIDCDDGDPCTKDYCDTDKGCLTSPAEINECDDNDACTEQDFCQQGVCKGEPMVCDDANPCTLDTCDPVVGCQTQPTSDECDDGNKCTTSDTCVAGQCQAGVAAKCDDNNSCTNDSCDPSQGCINAPNSLPCDDGDACTAGDTCENSKCNAGAGILCKDNNPCTDDKCNPKEGCVFPPNTLTCDDGNECTANDTCAAGACLSGSNTCECQTNEDCSKVDDANPCNGVLICTNSKCVTDPTSVITCDGASDEPCIASVCDQESGACVKKPQNEGAPCKNSSLCAATAQCVEGACTPQSQVDCDDGNACTKDFCDANQGCINESLSETNCDDGNACTLTDLCKSGQCTGDNTKSCDDGNNCTADSCSAKNGCTHVPIEQLCDDNNPCTTDDQCNGGDCGGFSGPVCDDNNPCTQDKCDKTQGCIYSPYDGPCDDGDKCSKSSKCEGGECVGSNYDDCKDNNPCTDDACIPIKGCVFTPNQAACDDGDGCTVFDQCLKAKCQSGTPKVCDDGNPCTNDACVDGKCEFIDNPDANCDCQTTADCAPLDDQNPCNGTLFCDSYSCVVDPKTVPAAGEKCDDGNPCTEVDECADGACVGSGAMSCDDDDPCTNDSCDPETGCVNTAVSCDENTLCVEGNCVESCDLDKDKTRCANDNKAVETCTATDAGTVGYWTTENCEGDASAQTCAFSDELEAFHCCVPDCEDKACGEPANCQVPCGECSATSLCCLPGDPCADDNADNTYQCLSTEEPTPQDSDAGLAITEDASAETNGQTGTTQATVPTENDTNPANSSSDGGCQKTKGNQGFPSVFWMTMLMLLGWRFNRLRSWASE